MGLKKSQLESKILELEKDNAEEQTKRYAAENHAVDLLRQIEICQEDIDNLRRMDMNGRMQYADLRGYVRGLREMLEGLGIKLSDHDRTGQDGKVCIDPGFLPKPRNLNG